MARDKFYIVLYCIVTADWILTAFAVVFLLNVGHLSTGSPAHLTGVVVVDAVGGADRPAVDRVAVAVARLKALAPRHQTIHRRHAVRSEAARLASARVLDVCGIDITAGRRGGQKAAGKRQEEHDGRRPTGDRGRRR